MLSLGGDRWSEYGERDQANPMLAAVPGEEVMTYEELLSQADPAIAKALTPESFKPSMMPTKRPSLPLKKR